MLSATEAYNTLLAAYGTPRWWSEDPFVVLVQSVLVQNTTWSTVEKTWAALGGRLTPEAVERLSGQELERLIAPCGFQKAKACTIRELAGWFRGYGCDPRRLEEVPLPQLRGELLALRGIGPETADVILVYAFYRPSFVIDAYTRRLLDRLGYGFPDDDAIRCFFEEGLPRDARVYGQFHWLILDHCILRCRKVPRCGQCPFRDRCRYPAEAEKAALEGREKWN